MDVRVATLTDDQGLATARGHPLNSGRPLGPSRPAEVLQRPNVVHLDVLLRAAQLAGVGQEPPFAFCPPSPGRRALIVEDCPCLVPQRVSVLVNACSMIHFRRPKRWRL